MLVKHGAIYFFGKILPGVVNLFAITIYARKLGAEAYGSYALVIAAVGFLCSFFSQWPIVSVGRYYPGSEGEERKRLISTGVFALVVSLFAGVCVASIVFIFVGEDVGGELFLCIVLIGVVQTWFDFNLRLINGGLKPASYVAAYFIKSISTFFLALFSIWLGYGLVGVLCSVFIGLFVSSFWANKISFDTFRIRPDFCVLKKLFIYGFPVAISVGLVFLIDATDRFLLAHFKGVHEAGYYAAIYDITQQTLGMLMGVVHLALLPIVIKSYEAGGKEKADRALKNGLFLLFLIGAPSVFGLSILSENVVSVLLGEGYNGAGEIMPLIALAIFFSCIKSFYFDYSYQLTGNMRGLVFIASVGMVVNLVLNIVLIPRYGVFGAAISACFSFGTCLLLSWFLGRKLYSLPLPSIEFWKVIFATLVMSAAVYFVSHWRGVFFLTLQILIGVFTFGFCILLLNREYFSFLKDYLGRRNEEK